MEAHDESSPMELAFVLMGTEGERYDAYIQTLADGRVNYYRKTDGGWVGFESCESLVVVHPVVPQVDGCGPVLP